ncbi:MAG: DUF4056 domain-containing protein, partial [Myxococcota bacterium]
VQLRFTPVAYDGSMKNRSLRGVVLSATALSFVACSYPDRGHSLERLGADLGLQTTAEAYDSPKMRLGTMPFDAWYSPLIPLGVDDLGRHTYVAPGVEGDWGDEASRGTLYAAEAGFLDIAHVRNAIDLTRFCFDRVTACFYHGVDELDIVAAEPDVYHVTFTPPDAWRGLSERERNDPEVLADVREASIQIAGRLAYLMTTWHEVVTAFGYKGLGFVTEKPSAFSYDDAVSHRVGVEAAMRALRHDHNLANFDATVTAMLHDYLIELAVLPATEVVKRTEQAEGRYWDGSEPTRRIIDLGMDDQPLTAHILDNDRLTPWQWDWPGDSRVGGIASTTCLTSRSN